jgi:hypothetical protein
MFSPSSGSTNKKPALRSWQGLQSIIHEDMTVFIPTTVGTSSPTLYITFLQKGLNKQQESNDSGFIISCTINYKTNNTHQNTELYYQQQKNM